MLWRGWSPNESERCLLPAARCPLRLLRGAVNAGGAMAVEGRRHFRRSEEK